MRRHLIAGLALLFVGSAHAAEQRYLAVAEPSSRSFNHYVEVWGVGSYSRYASSSDPALDLLAQPRATTNLFFGHMSGASLSLSYDPSAALVRTSASGLTHYYPAGPMEFVASLDDGSALPISSSANQTSVRLLTSSSGTRQMVAFQPIAATVEGPLPGSTVSYSAPSTPSKLVDLVALLTSADTSSGFDLSGFSRLPVRLAGPTTFQPVHIYAVLQTQPGVNLTTALPNDLSLSTFSRLAQIQVYFDGVYGVTVDAGDYGSNIEFQAAKSWVDDNIRQINYEGYAAWSVASLTAVPEPAALALWAVGGLFLLGRRRQIRNA